jgi:signal transduction histidine kinase
MSFPIRAIGYKRSAMTNDSRFDSVVSLACHDLRTPLATIYGFARTLPRVAELDERSGRYVQLITEASQQMTALLDELRTAAQIEGGRWEPGLADADTLELATSADERVVTSGSGETIETDAAAVSRGLEALAIAAARFGPVPEVTWTVDGRKLELSPVTESAAPVLMGDEIRDLGSLVARSVIEALGGSVELDGETVRVEL